VEGHPMPVQTSASERIAALEAELAAERARAEKAERALADGGVGGFGVRAERLLRLAEMEAREMRAAAAADVTALIVKAQAEAEAHRHEVEKQLIERSTALDRQARDRTAAFAAREQEMNAQLESRRAEGERLRNAALSEAGFRVLTHSRIPPNDGGISFGQAVVAATRGPLTSQHSPCRLVSGLRLP